MCTFNIVKLINCSQKRFPYKMFGHVEYVFPNSVQNKVTLRFIWIL